MSDTIIVDNEYVTLMYHPETKIVHHQFHKFIAGQEFRDALNKGTELLQKHHAKKWLSDNRKRGALPQEDLDWTQTDWFPRTVKAGWKFWALVLPEKVVGQMSMQQAIDNYSTHGVTVEAFSDLDKAMEWLKSQ